MILTSHDTCSVCRNPHKVFRSFSSRNSSISSAMSFVLACGSSIILIYVLMNLLWTLLKYLMQIQRIFQTEMSVDSSKYSENGDVPKSLSSCCLKCGARTELITVVHFVLCILKAPNSLCSISPKSSTAFIDVLQATYLAILSSLCFWSSDITIL